MTGGGYGRLWTCTLFLPEFSAAAARIGAGVRGRRLCNGRRVASKPVAEGRAAGDGFGFEPGRASTSSVWSAARSAWASSAPSQSEPGSAKTGCAGTPARRRRSTGKTGPPASAAGLRAGLKGVPGVGSVGGGAARPSDGTAFLGTGEFAAGLLLSAVGRAEGVAAFDFVSFLVFAVTVAEEGEKAWRSLLGSLAVSFFVEISTGVAAVGLLVESVGTVRA